MTDVAGTRGASASNPTNEQDLKKATMALEQKRLEIETQKLDLERSKAKWTAISVVVPLLAATATVAYGFWSTQKQSELNFQLEAAKSIMQAPNPNEALGRAEFFTQIFPGRLPNNFIKPTDTTKYHTATDTSVAPKMEFIRTLANAGLSADQIAELWRTMFFGDEWAKEEQLLALLARFSKDKVARP